MTLHKDILPVPDFYSAANSGDIKYRADAQLLLGEASKWRNAHRVPAAEEDTLKTHLLLIDLQKDFCFPEGNLYVGGRSGHGAMDDNDRIARFIYRNAAEITGIICTMDTHYPYQIFFPAFWLTEDDVPPPPHTMIAARDIREGKFRPNPTVAGWVCNGDYPWLKKQVEFYCDALETAGKYQLYLWPPHCLIGSDGHGLAGVIDEARVFHSFLRGTEGTIEMKGGNSLTENYSVLSPEVSARHDGGQLVPENRHLTDRLLASDRILIAGQAASHCVKSTIEDLLSTIRATDPDLANKVYILRDCMSAVTVPDPDHPGTFHIDFTTEAEGALAGFEAAGMNLITSDQQLSEL